MLSMLAAAAAAMFAANFAAGAGPWSQFRGGSGHDGAWDGYVVTSKMDTGPVLNSDGKGAFENLMLLNSINPCVSSDGGLLFVYGDLSTGNEGRILALDAYDDKNDQPFWAIKVRSYVDFWSRSSPVYADGFVYWAGSDGVMTYVYKINAINGSSEGADGGWTAEIDATYVNCSPLVADGKVFFSTYSDFNAFNAKHYALNDSDGTIAWTNTTAGGQGAGVMAYDAESGLLYQSTYVGGKQNISAIKAGTGEVTMTSGFPVANQFFQTGMALKDGYLYVQDYNFAGAGKLYKVKASDLSLVWSADTSASGNGCPCVDDSSNVYVCGDWQGTGTTRAFDSTGKVLWTFGQAGGWLNSPAYVRDADGKGYVIVGAQDADNLYMLDAADGTKLDRFYGSGPAAFSNNMMYSVTFSGNVCYYSTGAYVASTGTSLSLDAGSADGKKPMVTLPVGGKQEKVSVIYYDADSCVCSFTGKKIASGWYDVSVAGADAGKLICMPPSVTEVRFQYNNTHMVISGYYFGKKPSVVITPKTGGREIKGKVKKSYMDSSTGASKIGCDISKLDAGAYDVQVISDAGVATVRSLAIH